MVHGLKILPHYFEDVKLNRKKFEIRKNDRNYKVGDELLLREFIPEIGDYTGRICHRKIIYIFFGGEYGIDSDTVILGLSKI